MTVIRCIDFETTGFPPKAGVVEAGWTDVSIFRGGHRTGETRSELCRPGLPIGAEAMAVHGITEDMVIDARPTAKVFVDLADGADVFCAHNAAFEQAFFGGCGKPWVCTYKVALATYPDLPTHRCGDLPGHLGLRLDPERSAPLHRAGPDAYVTAALLGHFLDRGLFVEDLIRISSAPRVPFGKHKGTSFDQLPTDYLQWAASMLSADDVRAACAAELAKRRLT
jgi:exodeoxyribonuclease X